MTHDMTTGAPLRRILAFCGPLLVGNLFQQLYNLADSILVGRILGVNAFAAVGSTASLTFLVLGFALGLCSGFAIPVSQSYGAGDEKAVRDRVGQLIWLGLAFSALIVAFSALWTDDILRLTQTPEDIFDDAFRYIQIVFFGAGATILYNLSSAVLRALGDSKTPLWFLIAAVAANVALDVLFMQVLHMGVEGAALATVLSQAAAGAACLVYIRLRVPMLHLRWENIAPDKRRMCMIAGIGVPMGLQFSITAVGSIMVQSAVNGLRTVAVAAVSAATRVHTLISAPLDTCGVAMATYCGQNLGAGKLRRISEGIRSITIVACGYCAAALLFNLFAGRALTAVFVGGAETAILDASEQYLATVGAAYPLLAIIFIYRNSLQGMGFSMQAMAAGVAELIARASVAFGLVSRFGYQAVCFANPAAWIAADAVLLFLYAFELQRLRRTAAVNSAQAALNRS